MKPIFVIVILFVLLSCNNEQINNDAKKISNSITYENTDKPIERKSIQYTEKELNKYLDSIGALPEHPQIDNVAFMPDSIFKSQQEIDKSISPKNFKILKEAILSNAIDYKSALNIFGSFQIDSIYIQRNLIPVEFFPFDIKKEEFEEFAICLGSSDLDWSCELFFFKSNKIIAKHNIHHRYGLELEHYKDGDGKTIIYYKENFQSGTGIWWFNYYFYKYYDNKLIPVLNELENSNLQFPWSIRVLWLESFIQKTNPLTIKMVYYQAFSDTVISPRFVDDSTVIKYTWDEKSKSLIGGYEKSKITKPQILSYYLEDNELLFINAYYKTLKANLNNNELKEATLKYLNEVKNHYDNNSITE
jgi:hypothetical protein